MSQINSASIGTGEQVFTGEEIRVAAGYEGSPEPLPEVDDDEEESEVTDTTGNLKDPTGADRLERGQ
jgi:hypothetical protein